MPRSLGRCVHCFLWPWPNLPASGRRDRGPDDCAANSNRTVAACCSFPHTDDIPGDSPADTRDRHGLRSHPNCDSPCGCGRRRVRLPYSRLAGVLLDVGRFAALHELLTVQQVPR